MVTREIHLKAPEEEGYAENCKKYEAEVEEISKEICKLGLESKHKK
jgi:hypothetical protein